MCVRARACVEEALREALLGGNICCCWLLFVDAYKSGPPRPTTPWDFLMC